MSCPLGYSVSRAPSPVRRKRHQYEGHEGDEDREGDEVSSVERGFGVWVGVGAGAAAFWLVNRAPLPGQSHAVGP